MINFEKKTISILLIFFTCSLLFGIYYFKTLHVNKFYINIDKNIFQYTYEINEKLQEFHLKRGSNFIKFIDGKNENIFVLNFKKSLLTLSKDNISLTLFKPGFEEFENGIVPFISKQDSKTTRRCFSKNMGVMILHGIKTKVLLVMCEYGKKDEGYNLEIIVHEKFGLVSFVLRHVKDNKVQKVYNMSLKIIKYQNENNVIFLPKQDFNSSKFQNTATIKNDLISKN